MVLNVSTRKYHRAVRLPEGDLAKARGPSKSAVSRRCGAVAQEDEGLARLGPLGARPAGHPDRRSACRRPLPANFDKQRPYGTVVVQALLDNLARGLDPTLPRLGVIVDGAKALSKAIRNTFGVAAAIQRCQVHKGRNIIGACPNICTRASPPLAGPGRRVARNRRLEHEEPGVSGILEGLEEILTPASACARTPALACLHQHHRERARHGAFTRNVKRWRHAEMALRWTPPACWRPRRPSVASRPIAAAHPPKRSPGALEKGSGRQCH